MNGINPVLFFICIEIVAITIVLYYLAKAVKEGRGRGFKWAGYILLVVGFLVLGCSLSGGLMRMMHHGDGERYGWYHHGGCPMMGRGHCCDDDDKCDMKGSDKNCCKDGMMKEGEECCKGGKMIGGKCVMDDSMKKMKPDSTKGK